MVNQEEITAYYNKLANDYDEDRFENTYGSYIHKQEARFLNKHWKYQELKSLDLACGTGRWTHLTQFGVDISPNMINESKLKFPNKEFFCTNGDSLPFKENELDATLSFHLIMHLDKQKLGGILQEVHRVTKTGGVFVFDFPSKKRRSLFKKNRTGWHGSYSLTIKELKDIMGDDWSLKKVRGVLFFPIHRFPAFSRKFFMIIDNLFCASFLKSYSSYLIVELQKK